MVTRIRIGVRSAGHTLRPGATSPPEKDRWVLDTAIHYHCTTPVTSAPTHSGPLRGKTP
jgi:hypothetical protein